MDRRLLLPLCLAGVAAVAGWLALRGSGALPSATVPEPRGPAAHEVGPELAGWGDEARVRYRAEKLRRWRARLDGEDAATRLEALRAWESQGLSAEDAATELIGLLGDASNAVRREARAVLITLGERAIRPLLSVGLRHEDYVVPGQVIEVLGELGLRGEDDVVLRTLLGLLRDAAASRPWRERAGVALGRLRPVTDDMRAALLAAAADPDEEVAACAIDGMGWLREAGEPLVVPLLERLGAGGRTVPQRDEILRALGAIQRRPDLVLPRLLELAEALPWDAEAQDAALRFGPECLPYLARALETGTTHQAFFALQAIQLRGAAAASLADEVAKRLEREPELYHHALGALRNMGAPAASQLRLVQGYLEDESKEYPEVHTALLTLAAMGPRGEAVVDAALRHERATVRSAAAWVVALELPRLAARDEALETLARDDPDERVRRMAQHWLPWMRAR